MPTRDLEVDDGVSARDAYDLDATASAYVRLQPRLRGGGVNLSFSAGRGLWRRRLLLVGPDSVVVQTLNDEETSVAGWDQYREVVMVITSGEESGFAYEYALEVEYDPQLTDAPPALTSVLRPPMPNPFHASSDEEVRIVFDLAKASKETRISVYGAAGELVWQTAPASRAARQGALRCVGRAQRRRQTGRCGYALSRFGSRWPDRDPYARSFTRLKTPLKKSKRALSSPLDVAPIRVVFARALRFLVARHKGGARPLIARADRREVALFCLIYNELRHVVAQHVFGVGGVHGRGASRQDLGTVAAQPRSQALPIVVCDLGRIVVGNVRGAISVASSAVPATSASTLASAR